MKKCTLLMVLDVRVKFTRAVPAADVTALAATPAARLS